MTPEQAEETFYKTYEELRKSTETGVKPLDQKDLRMRSWQAVIDALNQENDTKLIQQYLSRA